MKIVVDIKVPEGLTQEQQDSFLSNLWAGMRRTGFTEYMRRSKTMWAQASDVLRNYELITEEQYKKLGL